MESMPWVLIRVDSSADLGSGHVMRCLALAEALSTQGNLVRFACRPLPGNLQGELISRGYEVLLVAPPRTNIAVAKDALQEIDAIATFAALPQSAPTPSWIVVDHYSLGQAWHRWMNNALPSTHIAVVDDLADRPLCAHLLINQNATPAIHAQYGHLTNPACRLLLGPTYTLLRSEFASAFTARKEYGERSARPGSVVVFMGGADLAGLTLTLLKTTDLSLLPGQIHVLLGAMNPRRDEIKRYCQASHIPCEVASRDMGALLTHARGAIVACGMFAVELQALGVPSVLVPLSDIQRTVANYFSDQGTAVVIEPDQLCQAAGWQESAAFLLRASSQTGTKRVAIPLDGSVSVAREMTRIHFEHRHPKPL